MLADTRWLTSVAHFSEQVLARQWQFSCTTRRYSLADFCCPFQRAGTFTPLFPSRSLIFPPSQQADLSVYLDPITRRQVRRIIRGILQHRHLSHVRLPVMYQSANCFSTITLDCVHFIGNPRLSGNDQAYVEVIKTWLPWQY